MLMTPLTPPTAEGGALRAQSVRRPVGEPVTLDGTVLRVDPDTGAGLPGNPYYASADPNARRIIATGLRNPFRMTTRPGTSELWVGDVGWGTWEEVNRIAVGDDATAENFGWPCYEGAARQGGYDSANLNLCEALYAEGDAARTAPYYAYNHSAKVVPTDPCPTGSSSIAGRLPTGSRACRTSAIPRTRYRKRCSLRASAPSSRRRRGVCAA